MKNYALGNITDLKEKLTSLFVQKKKVKALDHYAESGLFKHTSYLELIKICLAHNFPTSKEAEFLDYLLDEYHINFLDWAHKTRWLKDQIQQLAHKEPEVVQQPFLFDMAKIEKRETFQLPFYGQSTAKPALRRNAL